MEKKKRSDRVVKNDMFTKVMSFLSANPDKAHNYKQISAAIGLRTSAQKKMLGDLLFELALDDQLLETSPGRFKPNARGNFIEGRFERKSNGRNWVYPDDQGDKIFVAERNSGHTMTGDRVKILLFANRKDREPEGEVVEIISRGKDTFVGVLEVGKGFAFLLTDHKTLANDIFIPTDKLRGGQSGDKAIVKIVSWPEKSKNPIGEVVDVLGRSGDNNTEMHAILAEFGLPYSYPSEVEEAANEIPSDITDQEIALREDFRRVTTFTIDPKDAKDFDDALSARRLPNGNWEIGVHIADVSHYVRPGSIIDKEAQKRATSVYLVDRTIPMLPEHLSNGLCSLRPQEDKLTFSAIFEMTEQAEVVDSRIGRTVINSDKRFTYEQAQEIIETGVGDYADEILLINRLAQQLRAKRFEQGAINFERHEVRFEIDDKGKPVSVWFKEAKESNKLVEEFMLLANRTVAEFVGRRAKGKKAKTFIYRIHDTPDPDKLANLSKFVTRFGHKLKTEASKGAVSKAINSLLDEVQGRPEENLVETITIRTMAKAVYSTVNIGHYGLAFDYYSHFTSPIRRYPDTLLHRLLERYLAEGSSVNQGEYEELCEHCSDMEQLASNAERASIKYKQVEFMADKIDQVFDGVISGVAEWGIYVELDENKCEGLVPMRELDDDFYEYDDKNYCIIGRRRKKIYRLGDKLTVRVRRANLEKKQLDFELV